MKMSLYDIDRIDNEFDGISATFVFVHIPKEKVREVIKSIYKKLKKGGIFFTVFTTSLKEGMQDEPLDNNYNYYAINYSNNELCNILKENKFEILENICMTRINKSQVGVIIAKKGEI